MLGRGLSQAAESLRAVPLKLVLEPGMSEPELAYRYAQAAAGLYPLVNPLVANMLALHLQTRHSEHGRQRARAKRRSAAGLA